MIHMYFRSIGFSTEIPGQPLDMEAFVQQALESPDERVILGVGKDETYVEYYKYYGDNSGLVVHGRLNEDESVEVLDYAPFASSRNYLATSKTTMDYEDSTYVAFSQDEANGNEICFRLNNIIESMDVYEKVEKTLDVNMVNFAGLSLKGTVILPVAKDLNPDENARRIAAENASLAAYLAQNQEATGENLFENLLFGEPSEIVESLRQRFVEEDLLSVVDSFFMPHETTDYLYSLMGEIEDVQKWNNSVTGARVFCLGLNVTGTRFDLYIHQKDLVGMPMPGMRFMGSCCMQGVICAED